MKSFFCVPASHSSEAFLRTGTGTATTFKKLSGEATIIAVPENQHNQHN
jgi:hypothetical protein